MQTCEEVEAGVCKYSSFVLLFELPASLCILIENGLPIRLIIGNCPCAPDLQAYCVSTGLCKYNCKL